MNFNSKNGRKRNFSYEIKASKSFIPMRKICLWYLILKRKEIIMRIHVYPNWKKNFDFNNGGKSSFSYESKASISFIRMKKTCSWCPIMKRKEIFMWILVYLNWKMNFNSKSGRKRSFSWNQSIKIIYPYEKNAFIVPNHKTKGDYYVNLCLS